MNAENEKRKKLIDFLKEKAFEPVLNVSDNDYKSDVEKKKLQDVQQSTKSEVGRFENYESAKEVKDNYLSDLNSSSAKKINNELKDLGLPRLPDLKDEFLSLCNKVGV